MSQIFRIRKADARDTDRIVFIMETVQQTMQNPEWFVPDDRQWIEEHIEKHGFTMVAEVSNSEAETAGEAETARGAETAGEAETVGETEMAGEAEGAGTIVAFFIVAFPENREKNLGTEIRLSDAQLDLVAHMDSAAVLPQYRGHGLQGRLLEAAEQQLALYPHHHLLCTVHPDNHASLSTMTSHDYVIVTTKEKYHGRLRHILYKRKKEAEKKKPNLLVSACLLGVHCRYNEKGVLEGEIKGLMDTAHLIPVCPEIFGGLATPRAAAERQGNRVMTRTGEDVSEQYKKGARETLMLAQLYGCCCAVLKERSPSCGSGMIYDGSHSGNLTPGDGVTAELLKEHGIAVFGESRIEQVQEFLKNI